MRDDQQHRVPGVWRLGWLLCMQPLRLHRNLRSWGLRGDVSLWHLRSKLRQDRLLYILALRLACWLLVVMPAVIGMLVVLLWAVGLRTIAMSVLRGGALAVGIGVCGSLVGGMVSSVAVTVGFSLVLAVTSGLATGGAISIPAGSSLGLAVGAMIGLATTQVCCLYRGQVLNVVSIVSVAAAIGLASGVAGGLHHGPSYGAALGASCLISGLIIMLRLPFYPVEAVWGGFLTWWGRGRPDRWQLVSRRLPYLYHDLLYLPVPGLRDFLVEVGESLSHTALAQQLLAEAAESVGQKRVARDALYELQAHQLELAASQPAIYHQVKALKLPFLPTLKSIDESSPLRVFQEVASALLSEQSAENQHLRERSLLDAEITLKRFFSGAVAGSPIDSELTRCLIPAARKWQEVVHSAKQRLANDRKQRRDLPMIFRAGPALTPEDAALFKGRTDISRELEQELAGDGGVGILLIGQRRVGKSSVLNFLPTLLGPSMQVVAVNFQGLTESDLRAAPFHAIAREVAHATCMAAPDGKAPWRTVATWLLEVEQQLARQDRRMLITIDEVEALDRGIVEGFCTADTLELLRAVRNELRRIGVLLVSASSLARLSRVWPDYLISYSIKVIDYLDRESARELLTKPSADPEYNLMFEKLYPQGGFERLIEQTAGQPCLLQHCATNLVSRLNRKHKLCATNEDIDAALAHTLTSAEMLFFELWVDRTAAEKAVLEVLFQPLPLELAQHSEALTCLSSEGFVVKRGARWQIRIPLFELWLRIRGEGKGEDEDEDDN